MVTAISFGYLDGVNKHTHTHTKKKESLKGLQRTRDAASVLHNHTFKPQIHEYTCLGIVLVEYGTKKKRKEKTIAPVYNFIVLATEKSRREQMPA